MRKSLILTLALVVLAVCGFGFAHAAVSAQEDKVVVTEQVVAGDPDVAAGVRVQMRTQCAEHLLWKTHYAIGAPDGTYSDFTFSRGLIDDSEPYYGNIELNTFNGSSSYHGAFNVDAEAEDVDENVPFGVKLFRAVAENTDPGSTHTEVLYVRDYYEYFPLDLRFYCSESLSVVTEKQITEAAAAFFRIPVPADYRVSVTVKKEANGAIYEMSMENFGHPDLLLWTNSVAADGVCYFTVNVTDDNGALLDTRGIPGGTGVYRLSYGGEAVSLETVFPFDPEATACDLHFSADQSKLLLTTLEDDTYYLTVIDRETMTELQKLPLLEGAGDSNWWGANYNDDFLVVTFSDETDARFVVLSAPETGDYAVAMRGAVAENDPAWSLDAAMDFNGETLVAAARWFYERDSYMSYTEPRGFALSVYDAGGLRYTGQYCNSLMAGVPSDPVFRDNICCFTIVDALTVTLP